MERGLPHFFCPLPQGDQFYLFPLHFSKYFINIQTGTYFSSHFFTYEITQQNIFAPQHFHLAKYLRAQRVSVHCLIAVFHCVTTAPDTKQVITDCSGWKSLCLQMVPVWIPAGVHRKEKSDFRRYLAVELLIPVDEQSNQMFFRVLL